MFEFMKKVREIIPNATWDTDNDGQIIIYTNLCQDENGEPMEITDQDLEDFIADTMGKPWTEGPFIPVDSEPPF